MSRGTRWRLAALAFAALLGGGVGATDFVSRGFESPSEGTHGHVSAPGAPRSASKPSGARSGKGKYPQSFPSAQVSETVREWSRRGTVTKLAQGDRPHHELRYTDPADGRQVHRILEESTDGTGWTRQLYCTVSSVNGYNAQALRKLDECVNSVLRGAEAASLLGWLHTHVAARPMPRAYTRKDFATMTAGTRAAKKEILLVVMPRLPDPPPSEPPLADPDSGY